MAGSKFSVLPLVADHYATLTDARTHKRRPADYATTLGVPLIVGAAVMYFAVTISALTPVLTGLSALTGLLFGFVIWVFNLRLEVSRDPRVPKLSETPRKLDELFYNAGYAALVALIAIAVAVAAASTAGSHPVNRWWSGVVLLLVTHLLLTLAMCLKRLHRAFMELTM